MRQVQADVEAVHARVRSTIVNNDALVEELRAQLDSKTALVSVCLILAGAVMMIIMQQMWLISLNLALL